MIPASTNQLLAAGFGYQISRSVRLRSSASASIFRTFPSAGNQTKWTMSMWLKRSVINSTQSLFNYNSGGNYMQASFNTDVLQWDQVVGGTTVQARKITNQVFRDPSSWYHLVMVWDSGNATASLRQLLYLNGVQITAFSSNVDPALNTQSFINGAFTHNIGTISSLTAQLFDGYLTEINFIDGQALTPSSFGETNPVTGVWQPKRYTGTYGNNGFYLNFSDPSAATAAAIGADRSGNGNNWTPNNISVTAGATYDSMLDVPTPWADGGNGRGNYAVMNPLAGFTSMTLSDGNLRATPTLNTGWHSRSGSMAVSSGKWYAEFSMQSITSGSVGNPAGVGILPANTEFTAVNQLIGDTNRGYAFYCPDTTGSAPVRRVSGSNTNIGTGNATSTTDVFMVAFDLTSGTGWFGKNGTWYAGDPAAGTGASITGIVAADYVFGVSVYRDNTFTNNTVALNFGQRPFAYTPPSGFRALNTQNLPVPTILKGNQFFDATTYTGTGTTNRAVVNAAGFQPDLVWVKSRSSAASHLLVDAVRGASAVLYSNATTAEQNINPIASLNSNGFSVNEPNTGADSSNINSVTYVGWQWKEGATQGFDIVLGNIAPSTSFNHSLGVAPRLIIVKPRSTGGSQPLDWFVYHASVGATAFLLLNQTAAAVTNATVWNNTAPTSSQFTLGSGWTTANYGSNFVAYLFAEVAGFSRFGSYTGNGSTDGPFIFTGFRPRYVLFKRTDAVSNWQIQDSARDPTNVTFARLYADSANAEAGGTAILDFCANGFKIRVSGTDNNTSGGTYIFAAFAEHPFKNALAR